MEHYQKERIFAGAIIAVGMICGSIAMIRLGIISVVLNSDSALPFAVLFIGTTVISAGLIMIGSAMWSRAEKHQIDEMQADGANKRQPASA
jgi:uncharacterized membrane protein HdeD (DUF308 family)